MRSKRAALLGTVLMMLLPFGTGNAAESETPGRVEPGVLDATTPTRVIARFDRSVPPGIASLPGFDLEYRFGSIPAVSGIATPNAIRALANAGGLAYLEADKPIVFALDTATTASRAKEVFEPSFRPSEDSPALTDASGATIDGRGVGIAIIDSGLDGTHPDFASPGKIGHNFIVTEETFTEAPYTVQGVAHGTHVAGIAAGNGELSGGVNRGAAPGATVTMFSVGPRGMIVFAAKAFDWILQNGAQQNPPIRVVNNSWGCGGIACRRFNPYQVHEFLATKMTQQGITVAWAVGNDLGRGWVSTVNAEATNPAPGIIGVANYDDADLGKRDRCINDKSSRGASAHPQTWPDIAAPGTKIVSTYPVNAEQNTRRPDGANAYREMSGTSMATPHVAGVAALMLQANPALRPGDIEFILKNSATKLPVRGRCGILNPPYVNADPHETLDGSNYAGGHGLIDAYEAVRRAISFSGIPSMPPAEPLPDDFIVRNPSLHVEQTLYLARDGSLRESFPEQGEPEIHPIDGATDITFTSAQLDEAVAYSAFHASAFVGMIGEGCETSLNNIKIRATFARVDAAGDTHRIGATEDRLLFTCTTAPYQRDLPLILDEEVPFEAGDRIRVSIGARQTQPIITQEKPGPFSTGLLYEDGAPTPSRIEVGSTVRDPLEGSAEECLIRQDCSDLAGHATSGPVLCGAAGMAVDWFGAPGSGIVARCGETAIGCVVPGLPTDPAGRCHAETVVGSVFEHARGDCRAITPEGFRTSGRGRCSALKFIDDDPPEPVEGE